MAWKLHIAGVNVIPGYRQRLEAQLTQEGLHDRVTFLGRLPHAEVLDRLRRATAFLFTSINGEPFSSTIIESLACGTPLIGSDDGSILEVVEPGVSALVYPRHEPAALAAHMERVLTDAPLRERLTQAGLNIVQERYTLDRILDQTEQTLRHVIHTAAESPHLAAA